jgi:tetraacyldisaccharide-1-P 4'-kinase
MYLLYVDESGNENDANDRYFVLAGIALFERQTFFLTKAVDDVQRAYFPDHQPIAFHASEIRSGRRLWRMVPEATRALVLAELVAQIRRLSDRRRVLFAAAVEKVTEEVCRRFDILLQRRFHNFNDAQRGLIIFSEGRHT